ncbi:MAG TPA: phosphatase PAP2 family protein [Clostridia bacterium]|nr:phosphatase PAP2 family protein [Clostridia bacterium]
MELIKLIQSFSNPFLDIVFQLITMMGEDIFFMFITAVIYWCIDKELGYKLGFLTLTSATVNCGVKDLLKIPRPIGEPGIRSLRVQTAEGYSFPSGHTQNTTTLWFFFMLQFRRAWLYMIGILIIVLVGISRLYLGVHTPLDVAGGMIIGVVWVIVWSSVYEISRKQKNKSILIIAVALALIGLLEFKDANYYKVVGALTGLLIGYLIEPRFIKFEEKASFLQQIFKVSFGLAVAYALRLALKSALPEILISDFFRYLILLLWITIAAPLLFKTLKVNEK